MHNKSLKNREADIDCLIKWYHSKFNCGDKVKEMLASVKANCHEYEDHEFNNLMNLFSKDVRLLFQWLPFIHEYGEYRYHIVLTFKSNFSDNIASQYLNRLLHLLNSKFFGKNYKNKGKYLKGFSIREYQTFGRVHFHILILDDDIFWENEKLSFGDHLNNALEKVIKNHSINKYEKEKNINKANAIKKYGVFDQEFTHIKEIYEQQGIVEYVLKKIKGLNSDRIACLTVEGVV